jgi:uncharacterized damage-inducible protein DinB
MSLAAPIAAELLLEGANTRKLFERIPEEHFDWKPHPKSMTLRELASHIVDSLSWVGSTIDSDVLDAGAADWTPFRAASRDELLTTYEKHCAEAARRIQAVPDARMMQTWAMKAGGKTLFSAPRIAVLRTFFISHQIHHRGQLDVYLRLKDVPLPQIYGPTADEPNTPAA